MIRRGFTVVELLIIITIMGILLTLAVVNLNSTQANARDSERKGDAESLALHLESYYRNQDPNIVKSGGSYPGTTYLTTAQIKQYLPDLDLKNVYAPGKAEPDTISLQAATNTLTDPASIDPAPSTSNDIYVYQPLTTSGALCTDPLTDGDCRRFNIYYYQESDSTVHVITSKNQ